MTQKDALRRAASQTLRSIPASLVADQSDLIVERLINHPSFTLAKGVCIYLAMAQEVQTLSFVKTAFDLNKRVFIPKIIGKNPQDMIILEIASFEQILAFPKSKWGIPEPATNFYSLADDKAESGLFDTIFVPAVAFDKRCGRLGHGRGYYGTILS